MPTAVPGVTATLVPPTSEPSPLRSDVAGFVGRCRRGPVGAPIRLEGWRAFQAVFGGLDEDHHLPWAVRGYFENGGEVAWIERTVEDGQLPLSASWDLEVPSAPEVFAQVAFDIADMGTGSTLARTYTATAASPGSWAVGLTVDLRYVRDGRAGRPEIDVVVRAPREPTETWIGLDATRLAQEINERSALIRLEVDQPATVGTTRGPSTWRWSFELTRPAGGLATSPEPMLGVYRAAGERLSDIAEVAIVAFPDVYADLGSEARPFLRQQMRIADRLLDRLVLVDPEPFVPSPERSPADDLVSLAAAMRVNSLRESRSGALYHPWLQVPNPLGGTARPLTEVPPSGHVAGVISRLDRERGAHHTPANARLVEAVGLVEEPDQGDLPRLHLAGVNRVRCHPRDGLVVWGGRTLWNQRDDGEFLAHRRLLHRLVRAIRRTAEPLVFENNGPELWLALIRAVGTVLLSAFRAGALKGTRPEQAFRIKCDEETNPPEAIDLGQCVCEVALAPAVPMEFIELRIRLSRDGSLEVLTP